MKLNEVENGDAVVQITLDVPLFIRLLEYAREDAKDDVALHDLAENAVRLAKRYPVLGMPNYDQLVAAATETGEADVAPD